MPSDQFDFNSLNAFFEAIKQKQPKLTIKLSGKEYAMLDDVSRKKINGAIQAEQALTVKFQTMNFGALPSTYFDALFSAVQKSNQLTINLAITGLQAALLNEGWKQLCDAIQFSKKLSINLASNDMNKRSEAAWKLLSNAIQHSYELTIDLSNNFLDKLNETCWQLLCEAIQKSHRLTIRMQDNFLHGVNDVRWQALCSAISASSQVSIDFKSSYLDKLTEPRQKQLQNAVRKSTTRSITTGIKELDSKLKNIIRERHYSFLKVLSKDTILPNELIIEIAKYIGFTPKNEAIHKLRLFSKPKETESKNDHCQVANTSLSSFKPRCFCYNGCPGKLEMSPWDLGLATLAGLPKLKEWGSCQADY